jgi:hypothetical protein
MKRSAWILTLIATFAVSPAELAFALDLNVGRVVVHTIDSWAGSTLVHDASGQRNHKTPVTFDVPPITESLRRNVQW